MIDTALAEVARLVDRFWLLMPMGVVGLASWSVWLYRWSLSRRYRPIRSEFRTTTSVVVPVYREDPGVLMRCLGTWLAEQPDEVVLVVDVGDAGVLRRLEGCRDPRVRVMPFRHRGKRSALGVGIRAARHEVLVLVDSDTAWEPGLLAEIQMPFEDPRVGGVGTRQNAYRRGSSVWRTVADWLVNIRYLDYVPAQGMAGAVACLSGRTAAYRRRAVLEVLPDLEHEVFLGRLCDAGDDGRLTWLILASGYRTVYQGTARATSMFPSTFRAFVKQRVRWSRNSYRCYLTAIARGWLWRQPIVTQLTVMQILLTPLSMLSALGFVAVTALYAQWGLLALGIGGILVGRAVRSVTHLREHPEDLRLLPLVSLVVIVIALPVKTWAAITMNTHGWLTRSSDRFSAEAQTEASLYPAHAMLAAAGPPPIAAADEAPALTASRTGDAP